MYLYINKSLFCSKEKPSVAIAVRFVNVLTILQPSPNLAMETIFFWINKAGFFALIFD